MSVNPSRADRTEGHLRRPGRSGGGPQHRGGAGGRGGGGGFSAPPTNPNFSSSGAAQAAASVPPSNLSANRSFKKSGTGHNGQSRVIPAAAGSDATSAAHNGAHAQSSQHAASGKPVDMPAPRNASRVPKPPTSQSATVGSANSSASPATPKGDTSRSFTLQFGTISPGVMNVMQIPARTSSAPPNLDEQKLDQAQHEPFRAVPTAPISAAPKQQQQPRKDVGAANQSNLVGSHPQSQMKRDIPVSVPHVPTVAPLKSSVHPMPPMPIPIPFQHQHPQIPLQFGGPNPQMQPPGLTSNSLQMTMKLPVGNNPQGAQMLFPGHVLQQQALMHQGQGMSFVPPIGHQLPAQLNLGIGMSSQFPQQQPGKLVGPRKTAAIKITDPVTHEEVKFDKRTDTFKDGLSTAQRSLPNINPQPQAVAAYTSHQMNYYSPMQQNSYNPPQIVFSTPTLTSSQLSTSSQPPRYNYPVSQTGQPSSFITTSMLNMLPGGKPMTQTPSHGVSEVVSLEGIAIPSSLSAPAQAIIKPLPITSHAPVMAHSATTSAPVGKGDTRSILKSINDDASSNHRQIGIAPDSSTEQDKLTNEPICTAISPRGTDKHGTIIPSVNSSQKIVSEPSLAVPLTLEGDSSSTSSANDGRKKESVRRSDSFEGTQRRTSKKDPKNLHQQNQLDGSNLAESAKVSSPIQDASGSEVFSNLGSMQTASTTDWVASTGTLPLHEVHERIPSEIVASKPVDDKEVCALTISSEVVLKNETSQYTPAITSDAISSTNDDPSVKECVLGTAPLAPTSGDDTIISMVSTSGQDGSCIDIMKEKILEGTLHEKISVFNDISPDTTEKVFPAPSSKELVSHQKLEENSAALENSDKGLLSDYNIVGNKEYEVINDVLEATSGNDSRVVEHDRSSDTPLSPISASSIHCRHENSDKEEFSALKGIATEHETVCNESIVLVDSNKAPMAMTSASVSILSKVTPELEVKSMESSSGIVESKEKPYVESSRPKNVSGNKKKKKKELYAKADAAGASDLYNAYKGPEEKHQAPSSTESVNNSLAADETFSLVDDSKNDDVIKEEHDKSELDDWEDAADVTTPKLKTTGDLQPVNGQMKEEDEDGIDATAQRKYSRDFLLTFSQQCTELPIGFEIGSDLADALLTIPLGKSHILDRDSHPSPGRITDRSAGVSRDRRGSGTMDDDKWIKSSRSFGTVHDLRLDIAPGTAVVSLRPGQGANTGVLRNPRAQSTNQFGGGILSGPVQSLKSQSGMSRSNSDADRWQRGPQRGLIPSPQTPLQVMHKAERKYEVGKVSDEEEAKQRQLKGILNKLTPQNFEKLFAQVKEVNIDNAITLTGVISQIFDKALMEPTFCEMYANFCVHLADELPDFSEDNEKITFRRLLLNKCQEEFERGEREQAEADQVEEESNSKQSKEREEMRVRARRRMLGNIRLIGELYKKKMLTERIMHECIKKLLGQHQNPDEEDVESLCKLMSTIGEMIDHPKAKEHMDAYFDGMSKLSTNQKLSSRVRFMLKDAIDLRKNKWQQRRKVEGPKKIEEVHRDAAQERQAQSSRLARAPVISSAPRRGAPDYNIRGAMPLTPSSSQQIGGIRGSSPQVRGSQDVRFEDRHHFESKTLSVPLPQRSTDDSITLGPQGGLGRGMSIRGQPLISQPSPSDSSRSVGDHKKLAAGQNGHNVREGVTTRSMTDGLPGSIYDRSLSQDRHSYTGRREPRISEHTFDRSSTIPARRTNGSSDASQSLALETKSLSEEALKEKSILAIKEFYSAKDEEEVVLCIKELNASSFYPIILSLWITDSFERKDKEREMLADLVVNLCKSRDVVVNEKQLTEGIHNVLLSLEDAVNDAPKAAEFLGRFLAKVILEDVVSLTEIGRLIHEGGEEPGRLTELGLAAEVLGSLLECIQLEKGESTLNDIVSNSALNLKDFLPPHPSRIKKLDKFLST